MSLISLPGIAELVSEVNSVMYDSRLITIALGKFQPDVTSPHAQVTFDICTALRRKDPDIDKVLKEAMATLAVQTNAALLSIYIFKSSLITTQSMPAGG